jgi:hypothetical protein
MKKTAVGILAFAAACFLSSAQEVAYGVGDWPAESGLGNHRAVIRVEAKADAVRVRIPWRRRDFDPEKKNVVVIDAVTGRWITNVLAAGINRDFSPGRRPAIIMFITFPTSPPAVQITRRSSMTLPPIHPTRPGSNASESRLRKRPTPP